MNKNRKDKIPIFVIDEKRFIRIVYCTGVYFSFSQGRLRRCEVCIQVVKNLSTRIPFFFLSVLVFAMFTGVQSYAAESNPGGAIVITSGAQLENTI
jgi:hypothetical protein